MEQWTAVIVVIYYLFVWSKSRIEGIVEAVLAYGSVMQKSTTSEQRKIKKVGYAYYNLVFSIKEDIEKFPRYVKEIAKKRPGSVLEKQKGGLSPFKSI